MKTYSTLTKEYVPALVTSEAGGVPVDPTADPVQMAFVAPGTNPAPGDWQAAIWDSGSVNGAHTALCLIGPGGTIQLAAGVYAVWVKITDSPEVPAIKAFSIQVV
jgi:hypothetical protein